MSDRKKFTLTYDDLCRMQNIKKCVRKPSSGTRLRRILTSKYIDENMNFISNNANENINTNVLYRSSSAINLSESSYENLMNNTINPEINDSEACELPQDESVDFEIKTLEKEEEIDFEIPVQLKHELSCIQLIDETIGNDADEEPHYCSNLTVMLMKSNRNRRNITNEIYGHRKFVNRLDIPIEAIRRDSYINELTIKITPASDSESD